MPPKLILHAGTHKTGTTAIQAFAAKHRAALAARGVLYPDLTPLGIEHDYPQHRFAHALAGKDDTLRPADADRLAGLWAEAAAAQGGSVFLSSEPLYRHALREPGDGDWRAARARYLDRAAAALAPFEVEAVLVFRRPEDYVRSLFQENVMRATRPKWPDFAAFRAHALGGALRYADSAALFAERFPGVRCLVYEDLPAGAGFSAAFLAAVGIDAAGLAPVGVVRESLSPAQTEAKLVLHRRLAEASSKAPLLKIVRAPAVASLLAERLGPGPFGQWESAAALAEFRDRVAPEVERLRAGFFPDRAALFPPGPPAPPPAPRIDAALEEALVAAALAEGATPAPPPPGAGRRAARAAEKAARLAAKGARKARKADAAEAPPTEAAAAPAALAPPPHIARYAVIIGAMKAGTTSLYYYLAEHPEIAACRRKEPDFFTGGRAWRRGVEAYETLWPDFDPARHRYALEASTNYTKFPQRRRVPQRMASLAAERGARFKLIYILRNPIDRVESHVAHNLARRERVRTHAKADAFNLEGAVAVSSYARQLERFLRRFPREDLLILDFDELRENPRALVERAFGFLELEPPADLAIRPPANPRRDANGAAAFSLAPAQRDALRAALREDVTALRDRFGVAVDKWDIL